VSEPSIATALAESVREVLEKMFFVDAMEPAPGETPMAGLAAELSFDGNPPGHFRLVLDQRAARSAAADFLGEDPAELTEEQLNEVVCELANMICGSVLSRIESSATFRLSKPVIVVDTKLPSAAMEASFQAAVGGGLVHAEILMERTVCSGTSEYAS
jgi:CheY-specific phosphatase CheX